MSFRPKKAAALSEAEGDAWHREVEKSIKKWINGFIKYLKTGHKFKN